MNPRGQRLACSVRSVDGAIGSYSAYPGTTPKSISKVEDIVWNKPPEKGVLEANFTIMAEMGMTGRILVLNQYQWRALEQAKLLEPFYGAILWGGNPLKVVEDAAMLTRRRSA